MGKEETAVSVQMQLAASAAGHRLYRNNISYQEMEYKGKKRAFTNGLTPGSADLIGWTKTGLFLSVEAKRDPKQDLNPNQLKWLKAVNKSGGIGLRVLSSDEIPGLIKEINRLEKLRNAKNRSK